MAFISLSMQRGDRRNNPDSVSKVLWGVQTSLMKMNKRGDLPFMAAAFATYIFMGWRDSPWERSILSGMAVLIHIWDGCVLWGSE